jgi:hypothetical protein
MKKFIPVLTLFPLILFVACHDDNIEPLIAQGYVIGFDPCKKGAPYVPQDSIRGLLIKTTGSNSDTFLTYNLQWELLDFPDEVFENYQWNYFFPQHYQNNYQVRFTYRLPDEEEKLGGTFLCSGSIFRPGFIRYIEKEVYILSAEKLSN